MKAKSNGLEVASLLLRTRMGSRPPVYLVHALTAKCNARCGFCAWNDFESGNELTTDEVKALYQDARKAGFLGISMWGGEPLLRKDSGEQASFGVSKHRARVHLKQDLVTQRLGELLKSLNERYKGRIEVYEDRLNAFVEKRG